MFSKRGPVPGTPVGNMDGALVAPDTHIRLFGKPDVRGERRMGVALARDDDRRGPAQGEGDRRHCRDRPVDLARLAGAHARPTPSYTFVEGSGPCPVCYALPSRSCVVFARPWTSWPSRKSTMS